MIRTDSISTKRWWRRIINNARTGSPSESQRMSSAVRMARRNCLLMRFVLAFFSFFKISFFRSTKCSRPRKHRIVWSPCSVRFSWRSTLMQSRIWRWNRWESCLSPRPSRRALKKWTHVRMHHHHLEVWHVVLAKRTTCHLTGTKPWRIGYFYN